MGVYLPRGCTCPGVCTCPGGCTCQECVPAQGGVSAHGRCTCQGVYLPRGRGPARGCTYQGVYLPGQGTCPATPPPCEQNDRQVQKYYLAQTSFAGGNKMFLNKFRNSLCSFCNKSRTGFKERFFMTKKCSFSIKNIAVKSNKEIKVTEMNMAKYWTVLETVC